MTCNKTTCIYRTSCEKNTYNKIIRNESLKWKCTNWHKQVVRKQRIQILALGCVLLSFFLFLSLTRCKRWLYIAQLMIMVIHVTFYRPTS